MNKKLSIDWAQIILKIVLILMFTTTILSCKQHIVKRTVSFDTVNLLPKELALNFVKKHFRFAKENGIKLCDTSKSCKLFSYDQTAVKLINWDSKDYYIVIIEGKTFFSAPYDLIKYFYPKNKQTLETVKKLCTALVSLGVVPLDTIYNPLSRINNDFITI